LVVVGEGVGVGDEATEDEEPTPPQPMIRARMGKLKKNKKTRLKVLAPHESFERAFGCPVGFMMHGFLIKELFTLSLLS
jgi:hypothetical protein